MARKELLEMADRIRYDLTAAQVKLTELKRGIAATPDDEPDRFHCPECGEVPWIKSERSLAEHRHTSHGVPLPEGGQ